SGSELVKKYNSRFNDDEQTYEYELQPDLSEFTNRGFSTYSHVVGKSFPSELIRKNSFYKEDVILDNPNLEYARKGSDGIRRKVVFFKTPEGVPHKIELGFYG